MTITAMMHRVTKMSANHRRGTSTAWLTIAGENLGESFVVFMPLKQAEMVAEAFHAYEGLARETEGPALDYDQMWRKAMERDAMLVTK